MHYPEQSTEIEKKNEEIEGKHEIRILNSSETLNECQWTNIIRERNMLQPHVFD